MWKFVRIREMIAGNKGLVGRLAELERKIDGHGHDIRVNLDQEDVA